MLSGKKIVAGLLMAFLLAAPFATAQAGALDWLFGKKKGTTETIHLTKLDSSSGWQCSIGGACAGGKGLCCVSGVKSHLRGVNNIEQVEWDRDTGLVTIWVKKGETVKVQEITEALGDHWTLKTIEKIEG